MEGQRIAAIEKVVAGALGSTWGEFSFFYVQEVLYAERAQGCA